MYVICQIGIEKYPFTFKNVANISYIYMQTISTIYTPSLQVIIERN